MTVQEQNNVALKVLNERLITCWQDQGPDALAPMLYPEFQQGSILFIGINPSYDKRASLKGLKLIGEATLVTATDDGLGFFKNENLLAKVARLQQMQLFFRDRLPYFKRLRYITAGLSRKLHWDQIDLFQIRESSQQKLVSLLKGRIDDPFFEEQLQIFFAFIDAMKPAAIVVLNGETSRILKKRWEKQADAVKLIPTDNPMAALLEIKGQRYPIVFSIHDQFKPLAERELLNRQIIAAIDKLLAG